MEAKDISRNSLGIQSSLCRDVTVKIYRSRVIF